MAFWLGCILLVAPACSRFTSEPYSTSTDPAALMRLIRPEWQLEGAAATVERNVPGTDVSAPPETEIRSLRPVLITPLSTTRLLMIVSGRPVSVNDPPDTERSTPARLDAYWFGKRGNRWYRIGEHLDFALAGFHGEPGILKTTELDTRRKALAIENGRCRQGRCGRWLNLFAIDLVRITPLFPDGEPIHIAAETETPSGRCKEMLKMRAGTRDNMALDEFSPRSGCYAISNTWYLTPGKDAPGDLTVNLQGTRVTARRITLDPDEKALDQVIEDAIAHGENCCAQPYQPTEAYLATVNAVNAQLSFRFEDGHYVPANKRDPLPAF
jgi:hypothetical protein